MSQDACHQGKSSTDRTGPTTPDAVDRIIDQWRRERPDLDPSAKEITGRVIRLASVFQEAFNASFRDLNVNDGDYGILAPLRRAGAPYALTPTDLARHRMLTSGGMTAAVDRLERQGLVERVPNPADRRGSLVRLTAHGLAVIDTAMERHALAEHALVASLSAHDRAQLGALLRTLLVSVDPSP
jgi:DNA-binding MarR family transcriptional regulator